MGKKETNAGGQTEAIQADAAEKHAEQEAEAAAVKKEQAEPAQTDARKGYKQPKAPAYSVGELAANAKKLFGVRQECVVVALKAAGKTDCTVSEAEEVIKKFMKKEVK